MKPAGGVDDPGHADEPAGAADDLARDELAVAAAEGVDDAAARRSTSPMSGREPRDGRGVGFAGAGEERAGAFVVGVGE